MSSTAKMKAPIHAPSSRYSPPITATMRMSFVRVRSIDAGEICVLYQTLKMPAIAAMKAARPNASVRYMAMLKPSARIRTGSSRTPCSAMPNGVRTT